MMNARLLCSFLLSFFASCRVVIASPDPQISSCANQLPKASFELEKEWIYICQEAENLFLVKVAKNQPNSELKIPASGGFPTYAALEGDLSDPNSKIYNISPFDFKIIQASIIIHTEPVFQTIDNSSGVVISTLAGEQEKKANLVCDNKDPVQVFKTAKSTIYICIENPENNPNAIALSYVEVSAQNPDAEMKIPAELISSFSYQATTNQGMSYVISYQGLETYQNGQKIDVEPVTNVYLIPSDPHKNGY
jgi:hypothetical protein